MVRLTFSARPVRLTGTIAGGLALVAAGIFACAARASTVVSVATLPTAFLADSATGAAVYCAIVDGFPNNYYGIKGTFSTGTEPYYGLTYVRSSTLWVGQDTAWAAQNLVQTDAHGAWQGYIFVRLDRAAPRGDIFFRCAAIPLSPIEHGSANVSEWYPTRSLDPAPAGTGGWLCGHAYTDPQFTKPASGVIVRAMDAAGRVLSAYLCQNSSIADGQDHRNTGYFRLGVPAGTVSGITARARADNAPVSIYIKTAGPWAIRAGGETSVDDLPLGDVDGDGGFGWDDVLLAARLLSGTSGPDAAACRRADIWPDIPDGCVTMNDVVLLLRGYYKL